MKQTIQTRGLNFVSFSESWLNSSTESKLLKIDGYTNYMLDRTWEENVCIKKGGQICCYIRDNLSVSLFFFLNPLFILNMRHRQMPVYIASPASSMHFTVII